MFHSCTRLLEGMSGNSVFSSLWFLSEPLGILWTRAVVSSGIMIQCEGFSGGSDGCPTQ